MMVGVFGATVKWRGLDGAGGGGVYIDVCCLLGMIVLCCGNRSRSAAVNPTRLDLSWRYANPRPPS